MFILLIILLLFGGIIMSVIFDITSIARSVHGLATHQRRYQDFIDGEGNVWRVDTQTGMKRIITAAPPKK
jgi:hypothetical protein